MDNEFAACLSIIGIVYSVYTYVHHVCISIETRLDKLKTEKEQLQCEMHKNDHLNIYFTQKTCQYQNNDNIEVSDYYKEINDDVEMFCNMCSTIDMNIIVFTFSLLSLFICCC
jgi:hypothetical protein